MLEKVGFFHLFHLVDAALFAIAAWRIYRMSRAWALLGLLGFVAERAYNLYARGLANAGFVVGLVILLGFVNGVRGTYAFHKLGASRPSM
jgi:hypothetical protein